MPYSKFYHKYDAPKAIPKDLSYSHTKNIECIDWFCPDFLPAVPNDCKVMRLECADVPDTVYILALTLPYIVLPCETPSEENSSLPFHQSLEKLIRYFLLGALTP